MRKLPLILAGLLASSSCFAELGQINIKSYLNQPLYATIPVYNVAGGDYANLSINLATSDKYKSYGVGYDSELGLLLFKVINQGSAHYLQITSTKSITSPVLNVLLHYQENNNDFYRQYTVLLNPISLAGNTTSAVVNGAAVKGNPIPLYGKAGGKHASKHQKAVAMDFNAPYVKAHLTQFNKENSTFTLKAGDSLYVPARFTQELYSKSYFPLNQIALALALANYHNLRDKNYVYESDFTIVLPTPQQISSLPIELVDEYIWSSEGNVEHNINTLAQLATKFDPSLEINGDANVFSINAPTSVKAKPAASGAVKANASNAATQNKPKYVPPVYNEPSIIDDILDYKLEIAAGLLALVGVLLVLKRRKQSAKSEPKRSSHSDSSSKSGEPAESAKPKKGLLKRKPASSKKVATEEIHEEINFPELNNVETPKQAKNEQAVDVKIEPVVQAPVKTDAVLNFATSVEVVQKEEKKAFELTYPESSSPYATSNIGTNEEENNVVIPIPAPVQEVVAKEVVNNHNDDVINALEQILAIDDSRNDIRLKLFELYLDSGLTQKANSIYQDLDSSRDFDANIADSLGQLVEKYGFNAESHANVVANEPSKSVDSGIELSVPNLAMTPDDSLSFMMDVGDSVTDYSLDDAVKPELKLDDSSSRTLEFDLAQVDTPVTAVAPAISTVEPIINAEAKMPVEQRINLATMYYHIDEHKLAKDILKDIIRDATTTYEQKESAMKLINEYHLNG